MDLFRWNRGRQNTGYKAFPFFISKYFDAYILKYETGTKIPDHRDPISGRKHYRFNIVVWNTSNGGEFKSEQVLFETKRIKFFRPDISTHSVTRINSGIRYVLSVGWSIAD